MADGTIITTGSNYRQWLLLDASTNTGDGVWVDVGPYGNNMDIHFDGISSDTIEIDGINAGTTPPANSAHGDAIGTVTADGHMALSVGPRWLKARQTGNGSGTVSVYAIGYTAMIN